VASCAHLHFPDCPASHDGMSVAVTDEIQIDYDSSAVDLPGHDQPCVLLATDRALLTCHTHAVVADKTCPEQ